MDVVSENRVVLNPSNDHALIYLFTLALESLRNLVKNASLVQRVSAYKCVKIFVMNCLEVPVEFVTICGFFGGVFLDTFCFYKIVRVCPVYVVCTPMRSHFRRDSRVIKYPERGLFCMRDQLVSINAKYSLPASVQPLQ